jgi:Domain of unknown function (DUF4384)
VALEDRQRWRNPLRWSAVDGGLAELAVALTLGAMVALLGACTSSDPEVMAAQMRQVADGLSCASMSVRIAADGAIQISGFVPVAEDLDQLRSVASSRGDSGQVNLDDVVVYHGSRCREVTKLLADTAAPPRAGTAPRLDFNNPSLIYKDGDKLVITASMTSAFGGYLYVDYLDHAGGVFHLLPALDNPDNKLRAGQQVTVGGDRYRIGPPFGPDLVIAISSPSRLFPVRTDAESAYVYLPVLRKALTAAASGARDESAIAAYTLINTVAR